MAFVIVSNAIFLWAARALRVMPARRHHATHAPAEIGSGKELGRLKLPVGARLLQGTFGSCRDEPGRKIMCNAPADACITAAAPAPAACPEGVWSVAKSAFLSGMFTVTACGKVFS